MIDTKTTKKLEKAVEKRQKARVAEQTAWAELTSVMKEAYNPSDGTKGATFEEISKIVGVTKARIFQVVTGRRGGKPKPQVAKSADAAA